MIEEFQKDELDRNIKEHIEDPTMQPDDTAVETSGEAHEITDSESAEPATETESNPVSETTDYGYSPTEPQVIIQRERGFSHYVGFAMLSILCMCFFFAPGIAITFGVSQIVTLNGAAAWIFSAILSLIIWLVFKMKIKGFKYSFYAYIALCVFISAILAIAEVMTEEYPLFANIIALLTGTN